MSGAPDPALIAFSSLVYSSEPVPALTRLTVIFGYCFSNAATICLVCGAHAHTVSVVGCCSAAARDVALLVAAGLLLPPAAELLELLHAARPAARARPAVATDAVAPAFRQFLAVALFGEFSCIFVPSTSLSLGGGIFWFSWNGPG